MFNASSSYLENFLIESSFDKFLIIIEEMDIEPKSLFLKGKSSNIGKLYGKWKVIKQGNFMYVELYERGLL